MTRSAEQTRRRIIDAAYGRFYREGFGRVSIDQIAASAGVTKRTLYYHFKSKDELLASVLAMHGELALTRLQKHRYSGDADQNISALFYDLAKWSATPGWTGAGFTRLVMELADLPGHPARAIARRHKAAVEAWWVNLLKNVGVTSPVARAREMMLLMEGAMVMILIHGDSKYANAACEAAKHLLADTWRKQKSSSRKRRMTAAQ